MKLDARQLFLAAALLSSLAILVHGWYWRALTPNVERAEIFDHLFLVHDVPAAALWVAIFCGTFLVARWLSAAGLEKWMVWIDAHRWWLAGITAVGLAVATLTIYHDHPLAMDEYSPSFQARLFAAGRLWAEIDPAMLDWVIPKQFQKHFFTSSAVSGHVISTYWPGFALLLTPFVALGMPWLLNPLLAAGSLVLIALCARELFEDRTAPGWALLLALASPQFTVSAISYYSMSAHLFFNLAFVALLLRPTVPRAFAAGAVGSFALVLHQPLPHLLFALPWLGWLAFGRARRAALGALLAGYLPICLALGVGWASLRASIRASAAAMPGAQGGSVLDLALRSLGALALPDLDLLYDRLVGAEKLFLWAVPGLPILAVLGFLWRREKVGARLLGASAVCTLVGYLFVPLDQGHGWGFRYFHQSWGVLPLLAAGALVCVRELRADWVRTVGVLAVASLFLGTALRFYQIHGFIGGHLAQLPPLAPGKEQVCFLKTVSGYYKVDLVQNDPLLRGPLRIFDSQGKADDEELIRRDFPRARRVYDDGSDTVWRLDNP